MLSDMPEACQHFIKFFRGFYPTMNPHEPNTNDDEVMPADGCAHVRSLKRLACSAGRLSSYIRIRKCNNSVTIFAPGLAGGLGIDHRCDRVWLPLRTQQEKNFIRVNSPDSRPTSLEVVLHRRPLSHCHWTEVILSAATFTSKGPYLPTPVFLPLSETR
jgi:hypothetical protein